MRNVLLLLCWLLAFGLCNLGYWEFFRKKLKLDPAYYPSLTVMLTVTLLYLAGILNFLREASAAVWLFGLLYFAKRVWEERSLRFLRFYSRPAFWVHIFFAMAFFAVCYGKVLREYDCFTHWGLVVKQLVTQNHFPDYRDPVILFQTYPLGTAIYLYFGLSFPGVGMAEDMAMFLQAYMILCFTMALFSRAKKNLGCTSVLLAIMMIFVVSVSLGILDLRVDVVLGVATGCTLLYVWDYCVKSSGTAEFWLGACYMIGLSQIKNSAMLMVLLCSGGVLWESRRDHRYAERLLLGTAPVAAWFLWKKHFENVYTSAVTSYHAMTLRNYKNIFFENPIGGIGRIALELLRFMFTFRKTIACALCFLLVSLLVLLVWKKDKAQLKRVVIFCACFYGVYMFFLLAMYIFSMGTIESEGLPSVERYTNTALCVINYLLCSVCVREISQAELRNKKQLACVAALLVMYPCRMLFCGERVNAIPLGKTEDPVREKMEAMLSENHIPSNRQYCLLIPENDNGLLCFKLRYTLMSDSVRQLSNAGEAELRAITEPYVFVYDIDNPAVKAWLADGANPDTVVLLPENATE